MFSRLLRQLIRMAADRRGGVSVMLALMLVPLVAVMGLATETASWYLFQRAAQNAADAAALAAAANNCATASVCGTATYADEAKAVSKRYNFTHGADNTTVVALNNQTCPSPSTETNCYKVTVTRDLPIYLTRVVGFGGTSGVTVNGGPAQRIIAVAMAKPRASGKGYCVMTLNHGGNSTTTSLDIRGGGQLNLGGCDTFSTGNANCSGNTNGTHMNLGVSYTTGSTDNCDDGIPAVTNATPISDPFAYLGTSANIPSKSCPNGSTLPSNLSAYGPSNPYKVCGTLNISSNTTLTTASQGTVIIIYDGGLNLSKNLSVLSTSPGLTIIFSGSSGGSAGFISGNGTLDFAAPNSGTWSGVAIYQDPRMTTITNPPKYTGNKPTFNITGLIYTPYANLDIEGAINHQTNGNACISLVSSSLLLKGGGAFFDDPTGQCAQAGLTLPAAANSGARQALVQ